MKALFMLTGYTEYQASCMATFMWAFLILVAVRIVAGYVIAWQEERRKNLRRDTAARIRRQSRERRGSEWGGDHRDVC